MADITQDYLKQILDYDPSTGVFRWKLSISRIAKVGAEAGSPNNFGYIRIGIKGKSHLAHRLAWVYFHGEWPQKWVDHIDGDKKNNRINNLRQASASENTHNTRTNRNKSSGTRGVDWHKKYGKWMARIQVEGKRKTIGFFDNLEDAAKARKDAESLISLGDTRT